MRKGQTARLTLQLLVLSKAGVVHEVLLGLGPCGLEADTTHPIQDALQGLDVSTPKLLGLFLESHRVKVRRGWQKRSGKRRWSDLGGPDLGLWCPKKGEEFKSQTRVLPALLHPGQL